MVTLYYLPPQCQELVQYVAEIEAVVDYWNDSYGVALDPALAIAVACWESGGDADIVSSAGATGIFQVMPFHFTETENPFDPSTNIRVGVGVLADCLMTNEGNENEALRCYVGGPRYYMMGAGYVAQCEYYASRVLGLRSAIAPIPQRAISQARRYR